MVRKRYKICKDLEAVEGEQVHMKVLQGYGGQGWRRTGYKAGQG